MKKLFHNRDKCLECAGCVGICPKMALDMYGLDLQIDHEKCSKCGLCVRACPANALSISEDNNA
ncbi:MAG: 4Fe-4S binding protein [Fibrobacteraceae bacterium]|nr:4Fe-4S binding protein [Fibrobacteraceae bacterium]